MTFLQHISTFARSQTKRGQLALFLVGISTYTVGDNVGVAVKATLGVTVRGLVAGQVPDNEGLVAAPREKHVGAVDFLCISISTSLNATRNSTYFSREVASEVTQPVWPSRVPRRTNCSAMMIWGRLKLLIGKGRGHSSVRKDGRRESWVDFEVHDAVSMRWNFRRVCALGLTGVSKRAGHPNPNKTLTTYPLINSPTNAFYCTTVPMYD